MMATTGHRRFCSCEHPHPIAVEGVFVCHNDDCGERVADPLLVDLLAEVRALRDQVEVLGAGKTGRPAGELVDAAGLAEALGVSRAFVYERKLELGGVAIGNGPRPRWRFDVDQARELLDTTVKPDVVRLSPRRRRDRPSHVKLLPIAGAKR